MSEVHDSAAFRERLRAIVGSTAAPPRPCEISHGERIRMGIAAAKAAREEAKTPRPSVAERMAPLIGRVCACRGCDNELIKHRHESIVHFARRKYCSLGCVGVARGVVVPEGRCCPECGELLVRRPNEHRSNFVIRQFCSMRCAGYARGKRRRQNAAQ